MVGETTQLKLAKELEAELGVQHPKAMEAREAYRKIRRGSHARRKVRDPEGFRKAHKEAVARWKEKDPEGYRKVKRNNNLKHTFGITLAEFELMSDKQGGVCKICQKPETAQERSVVRALAVDHCHTEGHVRGLLCRACNMSLGGFNDDVKALQRAIDYLEANHKPIEELRRGMYAK